MSSSESGDTSGRQVEQEYMLAAILFDLINEIGEYTVCQPAAVSRRED